MKLRLEKGRGGAALMLSLWALFVLSAMTVAWALDINTRMTVNGNRARIVEAEAMACSGSEIALHPSIRPGSPALRGGVSKTQTYEARISGEGGRLNLNWVLSGENPSRLELLRKLLETRTQLSNLMTYMDGKSGAEDLIGKVLKDPTLLQALASAPKPADEATASN